MKNGGSCVREKGGSERQTREDVGRQGGTLGGERGKGGREEEKRNRDTGVQLSPVQQKQQQKRKKEKDAD